MIAIHAPAGRRLAGFLCVLAGLVWGCDSGEPVYVTASVLNLRERPTTRASVLGRLSRGQELRVLGEEHRWLKVRTGEEVIGWVHRDYVGDPAEVRAALNRDLRRRTKRKPVGTPRPDAPPGLNLSIEKMLAGFPEDMEVEALDSREGEPRAMGATAGGQVVEFWGDPDNLSGASLMVPVVGVTDVELSGHADLAVRFIRNAVPKWRRNRVYFADKLRELSSRDIGRGGFDAGGKAVRFEFIKSLGSVRIMIERI
jgi:hypothetical protein